MLHYPLLPSSIAELWAVGSSNRAPVTLSSELLVGDAVGGGGWWWWATGSLAGPYGGALRAAVPGSCQGAPGVSDFAEICQDRIYPVMQMSLWASLSWGDGWNPGP